MFALYDLISKFMYPVMCIGARHFLSGKPGVAFTNMDYRKISNIRRTKFQNLNDSRLVLHLSLPNLLKQGVK